MKVITLTDEDYDKLLRVLEQAEVSEDRLRGDLYTFDHQFEESDEVISDITNITDAIKVSVMIWQGVAEMTEGVKFYERNQEQLHLH